MSRVFAFLALILLAGCGLPARTGTGNTQPDPDPQYQVGSFSLTERSGRTVTDKDLRGSVWIASFIFTRCSGPCPAVSSTVARLQKELKDEPGVKFVTFTVDPKRDDLKSLQEYANARSADKDRWLFLTGDEETMHKLLREEFKQAVGHKEGPDVKPGDEFSHSTRIMLVDRSGVIRGIYAGLPNERDPDADAQFEANLVRLKARLKELLR